MTATSAPAPGRRGWALGSHVHEHGACNTHGTNQQVVHSAAAPRLRNLGRVAGAQETTILHLMMTFEGEQLEDCETE